MEKKEFMKEKRDRLIEVVCQGINCIKTSHYTYEQIKDRTFENLNIDSIEFIQLVVYIEDNINCKLDDYLLIWGDKVIEDFVEKTIEVLLRSV